MNISEVISKLNENKITELSDINIQNINSSNVNELASAIEKNTSVTNLGFSDGKLNDECANAIISAINKNSTIKKIIGIESNKIFLRNSYYDAKNKLNDILNLEHGAYLQECKKSNLIIDKHSFSKCGNTILNHIEDLKNKDPNKIEILTKALNKIIEFLESQTNKKVDINNFLVELKTNIDSDYYKQLIARICFFVGLCIMFASVVAIIFSVITGSALLIPSAVIGLSVVTPVLVAAAMSIYEKGIYKSGKNSQLIHYFFTRTTPEREDDLQVLNILEECVNCTQ